MPPTWTVTVCLRVISGMVLKYKREDRPVGVGRYRFNRDNHKKGWSSEETAANEHPGMMWMTGELLDQLRIGFAIDL